jgi:hypothetical protein
MFVLLAGYQAPGAWIFGASLLLLLVSLGLSLREIQVSIEALTLQIEDLDIIVNPASPPAPPATE